MWTHRYSVTFNLLWYFYIRYNCQTDFEQLRELTDTVVKLRNWHWAILSQQDCQEIINR